MHRRFHAQLAALIALPLLAGGCAMMPHSNMVVFGTNTVVGLRVGTSATQVPAIDLGYSRQEAVLLPVVANKTVSEDNKAAVPCDLGTEVQVVAGQPAPPNGPLPVFATHPCLLVAVNDKKGARDSYSVLASFGANFGAASEATRGSAQGGLSQYFATGMAAQLLALNGGAAVVATGPAAAKQAEGAPVTLDGISPGVDEYSRATATVSSLRTARAALADKVSATAPADLATSLATFEKAIKGASRNIVAAGRCADPDACAASIEGGYYNTNYYSDPAAFNKAIADWQ